MSRFADSPYFLLQDFMNVLVAPADVGVVHSEFLNEYPDVLFSDVIWVGGTNVETSIPFGNTIGNYPTFNPTTDQANVFASGDVAWNAWSDVSPNTGYFIDSSEPKAGILRGGDAYGSIVVDGGSYIDLYAKLDDYGFVPIRMKPVYEIASEKKYFRFDVVIISELLYDGTTTVYDSDVPADEPYYDSDFVSIQTEDYTYDLTPLKWGNLTVEDILTAGTEIYFRKDSSFHDWLKNLAENFYESKYEIDFIIRNYVNTDQRFLYFGELFPTERDAQGNTDRYHIIFNGMKDWVKNALPANNRTDNLIEFTDTYFDQVYSEGYQLLKNVWSLRDGRECDQRFLGYIPTFHGMPRADEIPDYFVENYREYAAELVWLMKRKGTYSAMYIIYDILCGNSNNIFNVLERWHDDDTGVITDYQDHIYTGLYGKESPDGVIGAGPFWYAKQDHTNYPEGYLAGDNKVLSPYYRVDLDLSVEPITNFEIIPQEMSQGLYDNWELQRPVNRQAEYNLIYAPFTDLTGKEFSLYDQPNSGQSITSSLSNITFDFDNFIFLQHGVATDWIIEHSLLTEEVIVTSYDTDFVKQIPSYIEVIDDANILVKFDFEAQGIIIISRASGVSSGHDPVSWRIRHGQNRKEVLWQVRGSDGIVYYPDGGYVSDNNTVYVEDSDVGSTVFIKPGIALGDVFDSTGDGVDDSILTNDVWVFDDVGDITTDFNYKGEDWVAWVIDHDFAINAFQTSCYDVSNILVEPADILLNELDVGGLPQLVVLWEPAATGDPNDYLGFAAISDVGDVVSFFGIVPRDASGDMLPVEYRLTVETETDIYTSLREGTDDANTLFAGKTDKNIHYWNPSVPEVKPFVYGNTLLEEQDDEWYYYTFKSQFEGLGQIGERGYKIIAVEMVNTRINRLGKDRITYSRISGIYKPYGVTFVGHIRIFKNELGIDQVLLDHLDVSLQDHLGELLLT